MKYFHAHLYYNSENFETAKNVVEQASELEYIQIGRMHERPVGPHPMWSCQLLFKTEDLSRMIPWLISNRQGVRVFIHPVTGDDWVDHTDHIMWLGGEVELNTAMFEKN